MTTVNPKRHFQLAKSSLITNIKNSIQHMSNEL